MIFGDVEKDQPMKKFMKKEMNGVKEIVSKVSNMMMKHNGGGSSNRSVQEG